MMTISLPSAKRNLIVFCVVLLLALSVNSLSVLAQADQHTPLQREIENQRRRLSSGDAEERRDAVMRLGALRHPDAARAAIPALSDLNVQVKVAAASTILWLPQGQSAPLLLPLLQDKDEFVRQEVSYALGQANDRSAVAPLVELLQKEKKTGVSAAIIVALGQLGDAAAVVPLAQILAPQPGDPKPRVERNEFVLRAAARSLGLIGSRAGVPALMSALQNEKSEADVRREAAMALGRIKAPEAIPVLRSLIDSEDPHLAQAAEESLKKIGLQ